MLVLGRLDFFVTLKNYFIPQFALIWNTKTEVLGEAGKRFEHFLPLGNPFPKESTCQSTGKLCLGFVISMGTHQQKTNKKKTWNPIWKTLFIGLKFWLNENPELIEILKILNWLKFCLNCFEIWLGFWCFNWIGFWYF